MTILAGAMWLGGLLEDGPERSNELGPAPIGSDPWLGFELRAAFAREPSLRRAPLVVEVAEAVVTIRGATSENADLVERAARTVRGAKALHVVREE